MKLAPLGAFGAMAFTIGKYGLGTLLSLGKLMLCFYATCLVFIFVVLGAIAALTGFNIFKFIRYIKEELLIVLGTSSSESVLPRMMAKMKVLGCEESVVGLVIPAGYSFNLDGTCIYLTMAALFLAQATNTDLTLWQQLGILAILLLTSKGAAGVTGAGFVTLAATLSSVGHDPRGGPRADPGRRPLHVGGARAHQPDRQRRGDDRGRRRWRARWTWRRCGGSFPARQRHRRRSLKRRFSSKRDRLIERPDGGSARHPGARPIGLFDLHRRSRRPRSASDFRSMRMRVAVSCEGCSGALFSATMIAHLALRRGDEGDTHFAQFEPATRAGPSNGLRRRLAFYLEPPRPRRATDARVALEVVVCALEGTACALEGADCVPGGGMW